MDVTLNCEAGRLLVGIGGDLDRQGLQALRQSLKRFDLGSVREVAFDLAGLGFIGTSGLAFLVETARYCTERNLQLTVINASVSVRELFRSLHLEKVFSYT